MLCGLISNHIDRVRLMFLNDTAMIIVVCIDTGINCKYINMNISRCGGEAESLDLTQLTLVQFLAGRIDSNPASR